MSVQKPKRVPIHHKAAKKYFARLKEKNVLAKDEFHIINENERQAIRAVSRKAMMLAAVYGVLGVALFYIPQYVFPEFFAQFSQNESVFGFEFSVNLFTIGYSLFLIFLEIFLLTRINIWAVASAANACGFPDKRDAHFDMHLDQLLNVGMEARNKETLKFGIDPYEGIPKFYIFLFTVWNMIKATLTNFLVKLVAVKIFARAQLRQYADLVGIPVFALWNAFATMRIIRNAKVYIMAPSIIHQVVERLSYLKEDKNVKQNIFDAMQYIVGVKRSFHHNHFLLVRRLIDVFDLTHFKDEETDRKAFLGKIKNADPAMKMAYSKLIVLGIFIDGRISLREKKALTELYENGVILINPAKSKKWCRQFLRGEGLDDFIDA
ncbi:MAG: hypothetical protein ACHQF2_07685 [Flavobacteriales bacterium]